MRFIRYSLALGSVVAGLLSSNPVSAQTADNFIGTWKLNTAKSKYTGAAGPKAITVVFAKATGGIKVTATGVAADGTPINTSYTATYDGKDSPVTGAADYDAVTLKMLDANTRHTVRKKAGKEVQVVHSVLAKDGKSFTSTTTGVNAKGEKVESTAIFEKQ
jgi:hypothetical protein